MYITKPPEPQIEQTVNAILLDYEAIAFDGDRWVWLMTPAMAIRALVEPIGRHRPAVSVSIGGAPVVVAISVGAHLHQSLVEMDLGRVANAGEVGEIVITLASAERRWPLRFIPGFADSGAVRTFGEPKPGVGFDVTRRAELSQWCQAQLDPVEAMWGWFLLGRAARSDAGWQEAVGAWQVAAALAQAAGVPSWAVRFHCAAAYVSSENLGALDEARRHLDEAERLTAPEDVNGQINTAYSLGLLAAQLGDPRRAAAFISLARDRAIHHAASAGLIAQIGLGLATIIGEAAGLDLPPVTHAVPSIEAIGHLVNRAWGRLVCAWREHDPSRLDEADRLLSEAEGRLGVGGNPDLRARVGINRAWLARLRHQPADARRHIDAVGVLHPGGALDHGMQDELLLLDGWLLLHDGRSTDALDRFHRLTARLALIEGGDTSSLACAAMHGRGRSLLALDQPTEALAALNEALERLDLVAGRFSMSQRSVVFGERTPLFDPIALVDDTIDACRALGRPADAFTVLDEANARSRSRIWSRSQVQRLSADERRRWDHLESELARLKAEALRDRRARRIADSDRQTALALRGKAQRRVVEEMRALIERAMPSDAAAVSLNAVQAVLLPDERLLLDWSRADGGVERWWVGPDHAVHCVRRDLADGLDEYLVGVSHLYVIAGPNSTAWATLPGCLLADAQPLAARVGISFLPSAACLSAPRPAPQRGPVVVADPRCDLPYAERDGRWIADHLDATLLCGEHADTATVGAAMKGAELFHFSGHGEPSGGTEDGAELQLAGGHTLRAEDVIVGGLAPVRAVLNGCDTGGAFARHGLSLPAALLAVGTVQVLVTIRPVPDDEASRFIRSFYEHGGASDGSGALVAAVRHAIERGATIWRDYRLIGGR